MVLPNEGFVERQPAIRIDKEVLACEAKVKLWIWTVHIQTNTFYPRRPAVAGARVQPISSARMLEIPLTAPLEILPSRAPLSAPLSDRRREITNHTPRRP